MVSSVASKWAFSAASITISKHRNCLDRDIIEALQCLKSLNNQNLVLRVYTNVADEEIFLDNADQLPANRQGTATEVVDQDEDWTLDALVENAGDDNDVGDDGNVGA